jgi:hypothetical protein
MQPNGSAISLPLDTSLSAMLTSEASSTCRPMTCADIPNAIGSQESEDGPSLCASPDSPMTDLFGAAVVHVSRLAPQAKEQVRPMNGTYGRIGSVSSASASLASSLAKMLSKQLDGAGSTLFALTWKRKVTLRGRPYCQLAASARPISGTDCGSWPSPCANQANGEPEAFLERKRRSVARGNSMGISLTDLAMVAKTATWPTPQARDGAEGRGGQPERTGGRRRNLDDYATLARMAAPWPTPMAGTPAQKGYNEAGNTDSGRRTVALVSSWPTPTAEDARSSGAAGYSTASGRHSGTTLTDAAGWATPSARDFKSNEGSEAFHQARAEQTRGKPLSEQAHQLASWATPRVTNNGGNGSPIRAEDGRARLEDQVHGAIATGSPAQTEKRGQLNPDFSLWLQGFPPEVLNCAPLATRSSRKSPQSS